MNFISSCLILAKTSSAEYSILVGLPPMTLYGYFFSSTEQKYPRDLRIIRRVSMSEQNKININSLNSLILQEAETDSIQEIDSDLYNSISELIKSLKSEEYDGIKAKLFKLNDLLEINFFKDIYMSYGKKNKSKNNDILIYQIIRDSINLMVKDLIKNTIIKKVMKLVER